MRTSVGKAIFGASLVGDPWAAEAAVAGLDVSAGAVLGEAHPTAAKVAAEKSPPKSNDFFIGVQSIGLGTLESGTFRGQ